MLMHPFLDRPYDPQISHFLGGFEIYDCEESLGRSCRSIMSIVPEIGKS
ncbi:hypothetical protein PHLH5_40170 [Pseudomonas sp. Cab53]|nr:hypothetical protein PHLH5_40170 [Pseudomonas sp. Cab53]